MEKFRKIFLTVVLVGTTTRAYSVKQSTLQQVHVVFRHGARAPDAISMYPKDPHLNDTWYPEGLGGLTNYGKLQEYNVGQTLRDAYADFLGTVYTPDVMDAWSTNYPRTKMSLQLVLAGLWPPELIQQWNKQLLWQPIPYNYHEKSKILSFPLTSCAKFQRKYGEVLKSTEVKNFLKSNDDKIQYINENSGLNCTKVLDLFILYFGLYAEEQTGRKLPEWTKKVYPEFLETCTILEYEIQVHNSEMKKLTGGPLITKILGDAKAKIDGALVPPGRKLFLYSGHEYNVVFTLAALNLFKPHVPSYASYVVIEFHKINNQYGFKILHQNYSENKPQLLTIPGCDEFCPIEDFIELTQDVIPEENSCDIQNQEVQLDEDANIFKYLSELKNRVHL